MKKVIILGIFLVFCLNKSHAQNHIQLYQSSHSVVSFPEETFDFGEVAFGVPVSHKFNFENISKQKICIRDVKTSCGCTTPDFSTEPLKPGKKGGITARYDSKKAGKFVKTLTVIISDSEEIVLTIKGTVKTPMKAALPN